MAIATNATLILPPPNSSSLFQWIKGVTLTSSDTTADMTGVAALSQATLYLKTTTVTGTSPTLDVYVQKKLADASTYQDIAHFAQVTSATGRVMSLVTGGNKEEAQQTETLSAATVNSVAFGSIWRISAVVAGTSPSFVVNLWMEGQS